MIENQPVIDSSVEIKVKDNRKQNMKLLQDKRDLKLRQKIF